MMTQTVQDAEINLPPQRHVIDDVTRRTFGRRRRDTAYQSLERRFRAELSRRLRRLRVMVEHSRGARPVKECSADGSALMPTIVARPPTGAWKMARPPSARRRCVSYQSVTQAVSSLTLASRRRANSSAFRRTLSTGLTTDSSCTSLSDEPLTSPEVTRSRDSMTSSASDLFSPWSVRTVSDSELLTTGVVSSVEQSAPQRVYNTRGYSTDRVGQEPGELSYRPRRQDRRVSASSHGTSPALAAFARHRNIGEGRQHGDADTRRQSSVTSEYLTHRRPDVAASASRQRAVDIVSGSSSQTGTGSLLTEQRRSLYTGVTAAAADDNAHIRDVTGYDVTGDWGHVTLSSTRLVEKLTATLGALSVDCRASGARNHGNGVAVSSERHDNRTSTASAEHGGNGAKLEMPAVVLKDRLPPPHTRDSETVTTSSHSEDRRLKTDVETLTMLENRAPLSFAVVAASPAELTPRTQQEEVEEEEEEEHRQSGSSGSDVTTTIEIDVTLDKGALGLGFCIDGGLDAPDGPAPITVRRIFKGDTTARGVLEPFDQLLTVNDLSLDGLNHFDAWSVLKRVPEGPVRLKIRRQSNVTNL